MGKQKKAGKVTDFGTIVEHIALDFEPMQSLFPQPEYYWLTTVRQPLNQAYSRIKFSRLENKYRGSNFDVTRKRHDARKLLHHTDVFGSEQSNNLFRSCFNDKDGNFELECSKNIYNKFDLVIPIDRFKEKLFSVLPTTIKIFQWKLSKIFKLA